MDTHVVLTVLWWCVKPSTVAPVAFVIGIGLLAYHRRLAGSAMLALSAFVLLNATLLPTARVLSRVLEQQVAPVTPLPATVDGIIVLGGSGAERLPPFADLATRYPNATLVFSGGGGEADDAYHVLSRFGDLAERTTYEKHSRNTYENALFSQQLVRPANDETWVLVTSATHMTRALRAFREIGWAVIAYPVGFTQASPPIGSFFERLIAFDEVCRELLASAAFAVLRTPLDSVESWAGGASWIRER